MATDAKAIVGLVPTDQGIAAATVTNVDELPQDNYNGSKLYTVLEFYGGRLCFIVPLRAKEKEAVNDLFNEVQTKYPQSRISSLSLGWDNTVKVLSKKSEGEEDFSEEIKADDLTNLERIKEIFRNKMAVWPSAW